MTTDFCNLPGCTNTFEQKPNKRKKLYCSDAHRKAAERLRTEKKQHEREQITKQKLREQWASLPDSVVTKLKKIQRTYSVWAAWDATQAVLDYQTITRQMSP